MMATLDSPAIGTALAGAEGLGQLAGYRGGTFLIAGLAGDGTGDQLGLGGGDVGRRGAGAGVCHAQHNADGGGGAAGSGGGGGDPVARALTKPISRLTQVMDRLAQGELDTEVAGIGRRDELGAMASDEVFSSTG